MHIRWKIYAYSQYYAKRTIKALYRPNINVVILQDYVV